MGFGAGQAQRILPSVRARVWECGGPRSATPPWLWSAPRFENRLRLKCATRFVHSERMEIPQPRVARHELPWVSRAPAPQLCKSCLDAPSASAHGPGALLTELPVSLSGWPRVARSSQPWAGEWNPVGICRGTWIAPVLCTGRFHVVRRTIHGQNA